MKLPEIEITIRFKGTKKTELRQIICSADIHTLCLEMFNQDTIEWTEEAILICLNRANKVIGFYRVSHGGQTGTVVDPKVIYTVALNCTATNIILAHNHPSGSVRPSTADENLTRKLKAAGDTLDIKLLDHLIIGEGGYFSFADEGLL